MKAAKKAPKPKTRIVYVTVNRRRMETDEVTYRVRVPADIEVAVEDAVFDHCQSDEPEFDSDDRAESPECLSADVVRSRPKAEDVYEGIVLNNLGEVDGYEDLPKQQRIGKR